VALIGLLAYAGLRPQEALALRWEDARERTLLVGKAADGQGGVKPTKTGQARTVRLLAPLADDLAEWHRSLDPADDALLFPTGSIARFSPLQWGKSSNRPLQPHQFAEDLLHDLVGAAAYGAQAGVADGSLYAVLAHVAVAAVDLEGLVGDLQDGALGD
jgi:integrase